MTESVIWYLIMFSSGLLFLSIGVYAHYSSKPFHFWAGTKVTAVDDVKKYNQENGRLWMGYSIWYFLSGIAWMWSMTAALILLIVGGIGGTPLLIRKYMKIEKKYHVQYHA